MPARTAQPDRPSAESPPVLVVGTFGSARALIAQLGAADSAKAIAGVILVDHAPADDASALGVPVLGGMDQIPEAARRGGVRAALVSLPTALSAAHAKVRAALRSANIEERFVPVLSDLLADTATGARGGPLRLDYAALIGREPRRLDESRVRSMLAGRRVLITGAGGSIGSELAKRCAALGAGELILMERAENALFEIDRQIAAGFPALQRKAVLHDVVESDATLRRFVSLRPQVVFHAAAHKHVPMMEDHPAAAVNNNLFGTKAVADASRAVSAERFVMISTDKAVNPSSVMGATKRLAEIYVRSLNADGRAGMRCNIVRFGNVLGSACSVLPIWEAQIAEGGPVTITHPEMTRYFMTIPEAASLVIHAAAVDDVSADVFVLDMGEPISIRGLAGRFIESHGLTPIWGDGAAGAPNAIRVLFTGIRPGEKLHEELTYAAEELRATPVPGVMAWKGVERKPEGVTQMVAEMSGVRSSDTPSVVTDAIWRQLRSLDGQPLGPRMIADAA